ncbi:MAG TPA: DUF1192 domain-containing protein [Solirubrobacterales bacterium]|nr:DUF1192 domain-containing protein [Solirubrobacterales bacterium]
MIEDEASPRRLRGAALADLAREDLDLYGVEELEERIALLKEEIARTEARLSGKRAGRSAADSLFKL